MMPPGSQPRPQIPISLITTNNRSKGSTRCPTRLRERIPNGKLNTPRNTIKRAPKTISIGPRLRWRKSSQGRLSSRLYPNLHNLPPIHHLKVRPLNFNVV
jgi:hypothetical protein